MSKGAKAGQMFYVYLLRSEAYPTETYVGFTEDLRKRAKEHNAGKSPPHKKVYAVAAGRLRCVSAERAS